MFREKILAEIIVSYLINFKCDHCGDQLTSKENSKLTCNACDETDDCIRCNSNGYSATSVQCKIKDCGKNVAISCYASDYHCGERDNNPYWFCDMGYERGFTYKRGNKRIKYKNKWKKKINKQHTMHNEDDYVGLCKNHNYKTKCTKCDNELCLLCVNNPEITMTKDDKIYRIDCKEN